MGNPHAVFWVDDVNAYDLGKIGPLLENHPLFPERANISLALVVSRERIVMHVLVTSLVDDLLQHYRQEAGIYPRFWLGMRRSGPFSGERRPTKSTVARSGSPSSSRAPIFDVRAGGPGTPGGRAFGITVIASRGTP